MPERLGLIILLRIIDSPLYAVECHHRRLPALLWKTSDHSRLNLVRKG